MIRPHANRRRALLGIAATVLLVTGLLGSAGAQLPPGGSFTDDNGNTHEASIEALFAAGITQGCNPPTNTDYCPGKFVTRAQMATFLVRALGLPPSLVNQFLDELRSQKKRRP